MLKEKKDTKMVSFRMDNKLNDALQKFHRESGITITHIVEQALWQYLTGKVDE